MVSILALSAINEQENHIGHVMVSIIALSAVDHLSSLCQIKPKTIKLVHAAFSLNIHQKEQKCVVSESG
jgi:hypothetical protein